MYSEWLFLSPLSQAAAVVTMLVSYTTLLSFLSTEKPESTAPVAS
jgi:hypothetical protein